MTDVVAGPVHGWKCFKRADMSCRGFKFEVGGLYEVPTTPVMCANGFHFHINGGDLFNYYRDNVDDTVVCEIIAHDVITANDKSVSRKIVVGRQLTVFEVALARSGYGDGDGYGYGDGYGDGYGYGYGSGDGYGDGYGYGYGSGSGDGSGSGYGYGSGSGYGDGDGDGDGYGSGSGDGDGSGSGDGYYKLPAFLTFKESAA